jgi:hypothetical protein
VAELQSQPVHPSSAIGILTKEDGSEKDTSKTACVDCLPSRDVQSKLLTFDYYFILLNRAYDETIGILLSSFYEVQRESILVGFSFGLSPSYIRNPLTEKPDDERILAFDFVRINGEKLRDPVRYDLFEPLAGYGLVLNFSIAGSGKMPPRFRSAQPSLPSNRMGFAEFFRRSSE